MSKRTAAVGSRCLPVKKDQNFAYNIYLEDSFGQLPERIKELEPENRKICIVTDSNVELLYAKEVQGLLAPCCREISIFVIQAGEEHKNLNEIQKLYEHLILQKLDRQDLLIALGGGVIGDMTGFAAATFLRGIRFVQIPTTLLSQVDSSIYMNINALMTLSEEQFACGMGEILKHGLIRDSSYYEWVIDHMSEIQDREIDTLFRMVEGSCKIKRQVVENDPTEKGERALLNFGHTIGHAIEKMKNFELLHGQCVALGTVAAAYISWKRGNLAEEEFYEIRDMNVGFDLPISFDSLRSEDIVEATKHDKKMESGKIKFVLLKGIGKAYVDTTVTEEEMLAAVNAMNADLWS